MSNLTTLPKGDSAWLFRKAIERIIQQISDLETNIGSSTTGNSANTQIIFNDNGVLRGDPDLTFNTALNKLVATALESTTSLVVGTSATISGDLTVKTNVLKVDTTNNRVGVVNASPAYPLDVTGIINTNSDAYVQGGRLALYRPAGSSYIDIASGQDLVFRGGLTTVGGAGASDLMRLNSTGLGVGTTPSYKLHVFGASPALTIQDSSSAAGGVGGTMNFISYTSGTSGANIEAQIKGVKSSASSAGELLFFTSDSSGISQQRFMVDGTGNVGIGVSPSYRLDINGTLRISNFGIIRFDTGTNTGFIDYNDTRLQLHAGSLPMYFVAGNTLKMTLDTSGNVGIGVTPSAWAAGYKGLQLKDSYAGLFANTSSGISELVSNAYNDGAWKFANAGNGAARYQMDALNRTHAWFYAATSANPITWTQAMTLAANGQLLLGTTGTVTAVDVGLVMNKPSATGYVGNVYQMNGIEKAYTYIASAASALRIDTVAGYTVNIVSSTNGVYLANGGTSWLALSDERFKDIIEPISNAVAKVCSLRSVIGKFKTESEGTRRSFLIAQDVQAVLPEAVDATKPDQLGVSYSDVIPLLVAAIKELTARVQTLETR